MSAVERLIRLEDWATAIYGDAAPKLGTLRRWAREGRITPAPVKHGRAYFVPAMARYVPPGEIYNRPRRGAARRDRG